MKRHQSKARLLLLLVIGIALCGFSSSAMAAVPAASSTTMSLTKDNVAGEDDNEIDFDNRELARKKRRNGNDDNSSSDSKGSKSGKSSKSSKSSKGSKSSKSSKGGSKGSKGGGGGRRRRRSDGPICGAGCGDKDFAYIHLQGKYLFRGVNDDSIDVVPIEGSGSLNNTKDGSTIRILDQDLKGYAKYFDHGDAHPVKNDIHGSISGSCTLLATYEGETKRVDSELCLAHCTLCVAYEGQCCQASKPYGSEWGEPWGKESCETYGGYATITADLLFALEFRNGTGSSLISIPEGGLVSLEGLGPITGTALELNAASNGGLGFIEYNALSRRNSDTYKIGLKVPFNDKASCKLQNGLVELDIPPPSPPGIRVPTSTAQAVTTDTTSSSAAATTDTTASTTTDTSTTVETTTASTTQVVTTDTTSSSAVATTTTETTPSATTTTSNSVSTTTPTVPTLTCNTIATPDPAFNQTCNQQQCECQVRIDKTLEGSGTFIDMEFALTVDFISSFTVDIATIRAFELSIIWFAPSLESFVLMEDTEASVGDDGADLRDFDLGLVPENFTRFNVAPYTYILNDGNGFVAPFTDSSLGPFNLEASSTNVTNGVGMWAIVIEQVGSSSSASIGSASLQFCGVC